MYIISAAQLRRIGGVDNARSRNITDKLVRCLPDHLSIYGINQAHRLVPFLAQIAHESAHFKTTTEYATGVNYAWRKDLGNNVAGDGKRFKGRGLIQLTGRANYKRFGKVLDVDLITNPNLAAKFPIALLTALEYWKRKKLNSYCDKGDFLNLTRRINGGYNGLDDRFKKYGRAALIFLKNWKSIKGFQKDHGLVADGVVGPNTHAALHKALVALSDTNKPISIIERMK